MRVHNFSCCFTLISLVQTPQNSMNWDDERSVYLHAFCISKFRCAMRLPHIKYAWLIITNSLAASAFFAMRFICIFSDAHRTKDAQILFRFGSQMHYYWCSQCTHCASNHKTISLIKQTFFSHFLCARSWKTKETWRRQWWWWRQKRKLWKKMSD